MDWYAESATTTSSTIFLLKLTSVSKNHLNWLRLWSQRTETQKATGQSATVYVVHKQGSSGSATDAGAGTGQATVDSKMQNVACRSILREFAGAELRRLSGSSRTRKVSTQRASAHLMREDTVEEIEDPSTVYSMFRVSARKSNLIYVNIHVHQKSLKMELDTGASVSVISEATFQPTWDKSEAPILQPSKVKLHIYTGEEITVVGCIQVRVNHNGQSKEHQLLVVQGEGPVS